MSDRIAVMDRGKVAQLGTPEEIYLRPETSFVAGFIGKANLIEGVVEDVDGTTVTVRRQGGSMLPVGGIRTEVLPLLDPGSKVTLVLRPEHVTVTPHEVEGRCVVAAEVDDVIFQGAALRYELRDETGAVHTALAQADETATRSKRGDRVWMSWQPEHGHLIPESRT